MTGVFVSLCQEFWNVLNICVCMHVHLIYSRDEVTEPYLYVTATSDLQISFP